MHGEKARWELHKNAPCYFEQILEVTPDKTAIWPLISHLEKHPRHCWKSKDKLISDVLQWTPTHRYASVG